MDKAFEFVKKFKKSNRLFFEMFGYPTIELYSDYCNVKFVKPKTIRSFDELRIYADSDRNLVIIFTFYLDCNNGSKSV